MRLTGPQMHYVVEDFLIRKILFKGHFLHSGYATWLYKYTTPLTSHKDPRDTGGFGEIEVIMN